MMKQRPLQGTMHTHIIIHFLASSLIFFSPVPRCRTVALSLLLETGVRVTASLVYVTPLLTIRGADTTLFSMSGWSRMNVSTLSGNFRDESKPSAFKALFRHWPESEKEQENMFFKKKIH